MAAAERKAALATLKAMTLKGAAKGEAPAVEAAFAIADELLDNIAAIRKALERIASPPGAVKP
jgi:hypothetical protein